MRYRFLLLWSLGALLLSLRVAAQTVVTGPLGERFALRVVSRQLSDPWEVTYGPDNFLWVTEARGYRVSRINPATGEKQQLLDLSRERQFPRYDKVPDAVDGGKPWPQGGLMGLALHPQLLSGKPYVYLAYLYRYAGAQQPGKGGLPHYGGHFFTTRLVRYEYDAAAQTLTRPQVLCDTIPGSNDHNGGRLLIAPVGGGDYLFYAAGDLGAGQFENGGRANHAQQNDAYEGKILRFNLEPDTDGKEYEQWIPNDNPFNRKKQQNAVWTLGHRNPQGLAYAVVGGTGRLYSSEHGPFSDDEINVLDKGKNYGHPLVIGPADGNYNGLAAAASDHAELPGRWHTTYPTISSEKANAALIGLSYRGPIFSLYPLSNQFLTLVLSRTRAGTEAPAWNSEAPSSLAVYTSSAIPGWQNSLLLPGLKKGRLIRLKLADNGASIVSDTLMYFRAPVRYRDLALAPNGRQLYLATDSTSVTSGPSQESPQGTACKGCLLELTYLDGGSSGKSTGAAAPAPTPARALQEATALVQQLTPQDRRAKRASLPAEQRSIFDLLLKPRRTSQEQTQAQRYAPELLSALRQR
ncbi:PQQ-dependent sugar dehydrogenase [Hymenobacter cellulosivorans]|uniref:PQQ-dependent sugar dehydrogenase n=1 Tax=Hymenobacter cellulosivorans TaxID=2932249 RepID=A0ABY4F970_9BACT|nr:PQQ-dependent sugar dehydrogenase [Hymenobacter cellulosivorans]UOQ52562.1 PQQ-dependent sugar dehydrogenase [Hymenobacter cellulosivorans]